MTKKPAFSDGDIERFNPPVKIVSDPPGYPTKTWPNIEEVRYGEPRAFDVQLIPVHGGAIATNPEFIRVSEDDPQNRSLKKSTDEAEGTA